MINLQKYKKMIILNSKEVAFCADSILTDESLLDIYEVDHKYFGGLEENVIYNLVLKNTCKILKNII